MNSVRTLVASAAFVMTAGVAGVSTAADMSPGEEAYYDLWRAVIAYERCNDTKLTQAEAEQVDDRAMELAGENLGAGTKLGLIQDAKRSMSMKVTTSGCLNSDVEAALAVYESQLAPSTM
ncbi:MAG: hypothetical protein ACTS3R_04525 [Inquilinaceae bacterium]